MAAYAFVCFPFRGSEIAFMLVLMQLMIMPEVLLVENYRTLSKFGLLDTTLRHRAAVSGLCLRDFPVSPDLQEHSQGARRGGSGWRVRTRCKFCCGSLFRSRSRPISLTAWSPSPTTGTISWPLMVTNSVETRPITVGLQVFATVEQGVDWSLVTAATLLSVHRCSWPSCCSSASSYRALCAQESAEWSGVTSC